MNHRNSNPIPLYPEYNYDDANDIDRDVDYMKEMYPAAVRMLQKEIDEECDKLEYDGSCMFDEYPSCEHLATLVDAIYDKIAGTAAEKFHPLPPMGALPVPPPRPDFHPDGSPDWLRHLIFVLLYNEMLQRRRRYRRRKRPYQTL